MKRFLEIIVGIVVISIAVIDVSIVMGLLIMGLENFMTESTAKLLVVGVGVVILAIWSTKPKKKED